MNRQRLYLAALVIPIVVCVLSAVASPASAQDAALSLLIITPRVDGFEGTFRSGKATYRLESYVKEKSYKARIYRQNGDLLIEARREGEVTFVTLPTGQLRINTMSPVPFFLRRGSSNSSLH